MVLTFSTESPSSKCFFATSWSLHCQISIVPNFTCSNLHSLAGQVLVKKLALSLVLQWSVHNALELLLAAKCASNLGFKKEKQTCHFIPEKIRQQGSNCQLIEFTFHSENRRTNNHRLLVACKACLPVFFLMIQAWAPLCQAGFT